MPLTRYHGHKNKSIRRYAYTLGVLASSHNIYKYYGYCIIRESTLTIHTARTMHKVREGTSSTRVVLESSMDTLARVVLLIQSILLYSS